MPKTPESTQVLSDALHLNDVVIMENHGVLAVGPDLETAYLRLELVEHLATIQFKAIQLGGARTIPQADIEALLEARNKAGLGFSSESVRLLVAASVSYAPFDVAVLTPTKVLR